MHIYRRCEMVVTVEMVECAHTLQDWRRKMVSGSEYPTRQELDQLEGRMLAMLREIRRIVAPYSLFRSFTDH